jgi:hypothetical protein
MLCNFFAVKIVIHAHIYLPLLIPVFGDGIASLVDVIKYRIGEILWIAVLSCGTCPSLSSRAPVENTVHIIINEMVPSLKLRQQRVKIPELRMAFQRSSPRSPSIFFRLFHIVAHAYHFNCIDAIILAQSRNGRLALNLRIESETLYSHQIPKFEVRSIPSPHPLKLFR